MPNLTLASWAAMALLQPQPASAGVHGDRARVARLLSLRQLTGNQACDVAVLATAPSPVAPEPRSHPAVLPPDLGWGCWQGDTVRTASEDNLPPARLESHVILIFLIKQSKMVWWLLLCCCFKLSEAGSGSELVATSWHDCLHPRGLPVKKRNQAALPALSLWHGVSQTQPAHPPSQQQQPWQELPGWVLAPSSVKAALSFYSSSLSPLCPPSLQRSPHKPYFLHLQPTNHSPFYLYAPLPKSLRPSPSSFTRHHLSYPTSTPPHTCNLTQRWQLPLQILPSPPARARKHCPLPACPQMKLAVATATAWYGHSAPRWFMAHCRVGTLSSSSWPPSWQMLESPVSNWECNGDSGG